MPIYEFTCLNCHKQFEELCSFAASDSVTCPACGGQAKRGISAFAVKAGESFRVSGNSGSGCSSCGGGSCASCHH